MRIEARFSRLCLSAFVLSVLMAVPAIAQVDTGTIRGVVTDVSGGVLPGATVTVTHEGQGFTLTGVTREDGTFIFTPIRTGAYVVEVEFPSFKTGVRRGINVGIQQNAQVDFTLQPGGVTEDLVVTADAPLLETGSGTAGGTLTSDVIENLPINGRDYTALARITVGVVPPMPGARAPLMFSANGVRPAQNNYLLDGIDNNTSNVDFLSGVAYIVKPPVDAVDQIRVMTSSFSAEYGRAGGAVLNTTLKSGTNQMHGTFWEFHRNDALNANDFFANRANLKKGEYLSNQYGVHGWRSRHQWKDLLVRRLRRQRHPSGAYVGEERSHRAPAFERVHRFLRPHLAAERHGRRRPAGPDVPARHGVRPGDHASGPRRTGRSIHRTRRDDHGVRARGVCRQSDSHVAPDADAVRLLQLYPEPNQPGLNNNYTVNRDNTDDTHAFDVRVDHNVSENDRFFARYSFSDNHKVKPPPFEGDGDGGGFAEGDETVNVHGFAASHMHMFTSTWINEARVGFSREHTNRMPTYGTDTSNLPGKYGISGIPQLVGNGGLPTLQLSGLSDLGHAGWVVSERFSNTLQFSDNLTKVYKSHTFKTGYMYQDIFFGSTQPPYARGQYNWDGRYTSMVNQIDNTTSRVHAVLNQIPSIVPGGVDHLGGLNAIRVSPFGDVDAFKTYHGAYVQDSWRMNDKFTLNYGLRWDYFSREQERDAEQANFVPGPPAQYLIPAEWQSLPMSASFRSNLAADGVQLVYTDDYGSGLGKMPKNNFAPRLDGAYQLTTKNVVRGGYGLFYGAFENRGGNPSLGYNYPFQFTLLYQSPNDVAPNRLPDGSLVGLDARDRIVLDPMTVNANGLSVRGVEFDYQTPRYHNYNLSLQSEVMPNHSVEIGYVGTRGRNLETFTGMNNVTKLLPPGTAPQAHVQWPTFARGSLLIRTVGVSDYNSLQMRFQRRYHQGLHFTASYTLSEATTNAGDSLSGGGVGDLRAPDLVGFDLRNDIGLSSFHTRHAFVFSGGYDLPGSGALLGGWRTDWVFSMYSGQPQTINCSVTTGEGTGCYANGCRRSLRGSGRCQPVLQSGGLCQSLRRLRASDRRTSARLEDSAAT